MSLTSTLLLTPFLTAFLVLLVPGNYRLVIRALALLGSMVTAVLGMAVFIHFDPAGAPYQFESLATWVSSSVLRINYHVGVDGIAAAMLLVTALVGFAAVAVSWEIEHQTKLFYILLLVMIGGALGAFASLDLFFFYFFNELALVPTFIMIGVWGHGEERTYAAFKITMYLTAGAMVALAGLIGLYTLSGASSLDLIELQKQLAKAPLSAASQKILFPCLLFGFGTLVGLFPFHSWAPQGYGCAPAATAMMHAGILKKAGLFAILRVALPLMPEGVAMWTPVLAILCVGNLLHCGFVALRQKDLNLLIGNSSLAHMGFAFLGIASLTVVGLTGTVLVMVSHALLAALSFALSGWIRRQTGTLEMAKMGGLLQRMPFIGSVLTLCFLAGCGVPGFANFAGEIAVMFGSWKALPWVVVAAAWGGLIIGGVYMLRALRAVLHGKAREELSTVIDAPNFWRKLPFVLLAAGLLLFGFFPGAITRRVAPAVNRIAELARPVAKPAAAVTAAVATPAKPAAN
jgi:NADH-quinone oxidoreductase subunit M